MEEKLISVIIPVYKVEAYLDQCVASVVNQTYQNLEIILVNDGSPDRCPAICDEWVLKDRRIKVVHKENGGLSDARNAGMAAASGGLIGFVDSDDWISPDMYQLLFQRMTEDDSDISVCGVEMVWDDGTPSRRLTRVGSCILNAEESMKAIIDESWLKQPVWYKLYKAELICDIPFPVGKFHEDVFWSYQAVGRAKRVSITDRPCYFYRQRSDSIMGEGYSLKRLDAVEAKTRRLEYLRENYDTLVSMGKKDLLFTCMYHGQLAIKYLKNPEKKHAMTFLKEIVDSCSISQADDYGQSSFVQKCWMHLAKINLGITCKIRGLLGIGV